MLYSMRRSFTKNNCKKGSMNRSKKTMVLDESPKKEIPVVPNGSK